MASYKVGIIGCGGRGREHAQGYAACDDVEVVAVADPVQASADKLIEEHGTKGIRVYDDYAAMLEKEELDVVSVCTWPQQHREQIEAACAAGARAIHAEKPMAPNLGDARAIHAAAEKSGTQLTFCHQRRFLPTFRAARDLLRAGAIGDIHRVEGFCPDLFDWGTHWFDMFFFYNEQAPATWVMGQIDTRRVRSIFGVPVELSGLSYIEFSNGVNGLLVTGRDKDQANSQRAANRILGSEGVLEVTRSDGGEVRLLTASGTSWTTAKLDEYSTTNATVLSVVDAVDSLRAGREPELSSRKALQASELIFATYESARRRARVYLPLDIEDSPLLTMLEAGEVLTGDTP